MSRTTLREALLLPTVRAVGVQNACLVAIIAAVFTGMSVFVGSFFSPANFEVLVMGFIFEAIMALGMTLVIISGGIDLSVGSVLGFSAIMTAYFFKARFPIPLTLACTFLIAAAIGAFNAWMTNTLRVHPFISTLAMMLTVRGLGLAISNGENVTSDFPSRFLFLGQGRVVGIPFPIVVFALLAVVLGILLKHHRFFQQVYFIGDNPRAAKLSGIRVERFLYFVFVLSSLLACTAGVLTAAMYDNASNSYGINSELRVITAVVLGGTDIVKGGTGTIFGTVLGIIFMSIVYNAFVMANVNPYWETIVIGSTLLVAVFLVDFFKKLEVAIR
ncbi:MAG TPA: ABC transporter permease [Anaeromyxobacter sp.]|nr:ABC transporter permease [Anaeromyxobacter sp.]